MVSSRNEVSADGTPEKVGKATGKGTIRTYLCRVIAVTGNFKRLCGNRTQGNLERVEYGNR